MNGFLALHLHSDRYNVVNIELKKKEEEEEDAFICNRKQNIDQYNFKIKSVIVSWCRRPPKDSRRVAFVEVTYESCIGGIHLPYRICIVINT